MSARWMLHTARLTLTPVNGADLPDLVAARALLSQTEPNPAPLS